MATISIQDHKDMIALMRAKNARRVEKLVRKHIIRGMAPYQEEDRQEARRRRRSRG